MTEEEREKLLEDKRILRNKQRKERYEANRSYELQRKKAFREENKAKIKAESRKYYELNKEKIAEKGRKYRILHKEEENARKRIYLKNNPHINTAKSARRRASKSAATPPWLTPAHLTQMRDIYKKARQLKKDTGTNHHVDHIVPLHNKHVCGMHVPWNLQVVTDVENMQKSNRFELWWESNT